MSQDNNTFDKALINEIKNDGYNVNEAMFRKTKKEKYKTTLKNILPIYNVINSMYILFFDEKIKKQVEAKLNNAVINNTDMVDNEKIMPIYNIEGSKKPKVLVLKRNTKIS